MGYESTLHLIDMKIKPTSFEMVSRALKVKPPRGLVRLRYFLEAAAVNEGGFLAFKAQKGGGNPYMPDDEGMVPAISGKWYEAEDVASWLRQHVEKGGQMVCHSNEADGLAWGWEFDGKGRMRELALVPVSKWA